VTQDVRELARQFVEDADYRVSLKMRLKRGTAPHMETLLHHYAYGKPKETLDINTPMRALIIDVVTGDDLASSRDDD
jgi:hypothetical protein